MILDLNKHYSVSEMENMCSHSGTGAYDIIGSRYIRLISCKICQYRVMMENYYDNPEEPYDPNANKISTAILFHSTDRPLIMSPVGDILTDESISLGKIEIDLENYKEKLSKLLLLI